MRFIHVGASLLAISSPTNSIASKLAPTNARGMASIQGVGRATRVVLRTRVVRMPGGGLHPPYALGSFIQ